MEESNKEKAEELYPTDFNYLSSGVINVRIKEIEAFIKGAEWKEQEMIEKIIKYLKSNSLPSVNGHYFSISNIGIDKLKQAMKGE